tara:strand:- start:818 stop:1075 length:258 start_codon:yes stop_codon:yes gene_type:complete
MPNSYETPLILSPDPRGNYVTWAKGKRQVRDLLNAAGYKAVGLFRPRKQNKNEFSILASRDGVTYQVTASRIPGAELYFSKTLND